MEYREFTLGAASAPIQIVHDFEFVALNLGNGYTEIRGMTGEEKLNYMKGRIDKLRDRGYGGVVLNVDFKDYLKSDEELCLIMSAARYAKECGLRVWIYDEQYYPTGGAGGLTLVGHPELEALGLFMVDMTVESDGRIPYRTASPYGHSDFKYVLFAPVRDGITDWDNLTRGEGCVDLSGGICLYLPKGEWRVLGFCYRALYEHTYISQGLRASRRYVNILSKDAISKFLEVTYDRGYLKHGEEDFRDVIDAIFTDEPHVPPCVLYKGERGTRFVSHADFEPSIEGIEAYPHVPWVEELPERFESEYGYSLITALPHLFLDTGRSRMTRRDFYTLTSRLCQESFIENYRDRLGAYGVALGGHYYTEETFDSHPICFGDILEHLGAMDIPGCDQLSSSPKALAHCIASKLASSAAHAKGKDKVMIEASNMMGEKQSLTLDEMKGAAEMMFVNGINVITSYYGEDVYSPEETAEYNAFVSDLSSLYDGGKYRAFALLYYPYEILAENTRPFASDGDFIQGIDTLLVAKSGAELMKAQIPYEIVNRSHLLSAKVCDGYLELPDGERISAVVFPRIDRLDREVSAFINAAKHRGVSILHGGDGRIDGLDFLAEPLFAACLTGGELRLSEYDPTVTLMQRTFDKYDIFHLVNTTEETKKVTVNIRDDGNSYALIDIDEKSVIPLAAKLRDGTATISLDMKPVRGVVVVRY